VFATYDAILQNKSHTVVAENSKKKHNAVHRNGPCCSNVHLSFSHAYQLFFCSWCSFSPSDHMLVKSCLLFCASEKENK